MSDDKPPRVTIRRGEDGSVEIDEADKSKRPKLKPEVAPGPQKPDPAQDVPREPNPYWGAG